MYLCNIHQLVCIFARPKIQKNLCFSSMLHLTHIFSCIFLFRLVEKARHRQQAIDQASAAITERIFNQQSILKRNFLDEISLAGMRERDSLQHWRRVIQLNTHPRSVPGELGLVLEKSCLFFFIIEPHCRLYSCWQKLDVYRL